MTREEFLDAHLLHSVDRALAIRVLNALSGEVEEHKDGLLSVACQFRRHAAPRAAAAYEHEAKAMHRLERWLDGAADGTLDMETELRSGEELEDDHA